MQISYNLRINYFSEEQGPLIVEGIAPAIALSRSRLGSFPVVLRRHWNGGPHVLLGLGPADRHGADQLANAIGPVVAEYLADKVQPDPSFAPTAFAALRQSLAAAEQWTGPDLPLQADRTIFIGQHYVPHPLDDPRLGQFRDRFKAHAYTRTLDLIRARLADPGTALIELACLFGSLHHLVWSRGYYLWPYSLLGQVSAAEGQLAQHQARFAEGVARLGPGLSRQFAQRGVLGPAGTLDPQLQDWIAGIQPIYAELAAYAEDRGADYLDQVNALGGGADQLAMERKQRPYLFHPTHFAYRMIMNFHYELVQTIGLAPAMRLMIGFLLRDLLTREHPGVLERMEADGRTMLNDGALSR